VDTTFEVDSNTEEVVTDLNISKHEGSATVETSYVETRRKITDTIEPIIEEIGGEEVPPPTHDTPKSTDLIYEVHLKKPLHDTIISPIVPKPTPSSIQNIPTLEPITPRAQTPPTSELEFYPNEEVPS